MSRSEKLRIVKNARSNRRLLEDVHNTEFEHINITEIGNEAISLLHRGAVEVLRRVQRENGIKQSSGNGCHFSREIVLIRPDKKTAPDGTGAVSCRSGRHVPGIVNNDA